MTELIGTTLGKYQLVARVGRGGMARVYKAYQASLDRYVALKVLHTHLAEDKDFVERFEREATAIARLRHPGIVQVHDYDHQNELYYIVMEFVEGPTLKAEISERKKRLGEERPGIFEIEEITRIFVNLADAIDYAHSRGMIHRDLKPGNIMFTSDGQILLTDFGLARMTYTKHQSRTGALSGTPSYMSPEQVQGSRIDQRSDIYSLGIILYELFAGNVPFTADTPYAIMTKHVTDEVPSISTFIPDFPVEVETVVLKSLSKDPDQRYQTANEFAESLQEAVGIVVPPMPGSGVFAPMATMADSQEMMPISTYAGSTSLSMAAITSPYRGLYAFREQDSPFFFGREAFSERLGETLTHKSMVAVIGPSGSGKSSVVFAGLVPKLREDAQWEIVEMRPGSDPFHALASAYIDRLEPELAETARLVEVKNLANALKTEELTLTDVLKRLKNKNGKVIQPLLIVDQFEEIYTLCQDKEVRRRFPNALFEVIDESREMPELDFSLIITLRADFMGQALTNRPFADALQDADVKLGPMTRAELARAIESPAAKKRVVFEAGLVDRILDDVGDEPGNLPLLEFALTLLWDRRTGRRMTHAAYDAIGRVEGSLARYADEIYEELSVADQDRARRVFTQMVRPGEGTEDTRRLATRQELSDEDWELAQRLADARLVVTGLSPDGTETVEIVHEALIRGWGRLHEWMNSERAFRSWQERLRVALHQWENSSRDEGALLRGAPLAEAREWLASKFSDLSLGETTFLQSSIDWEERRVKEREARRQRELQAAKDLAEEQQRRAESEYQRAEDQSRSTRNLRILAAVLAGIFVIAVVAAVLAVEQSQNAEREANARATEVIVRTTAEAGALENANLAATRAAESALARDAAESERSRANIEADRALEAKDEAENERDRADEQARLALARQLAAQSTTLLGPQLDLALLLSVEANALDNSTETQSSVLSALQFNPNLVTFLREHPSLLQSVDFSPDGSKLLTAGGDGLIYLWDLDTLEVIQAYVGHDPTQLVNRAVFSPDGRNIASASDDGTVKVWDSESGTLLLTLDAHTAWAQSVDFSPDGQRLVSGSGDRTVIIWDLSTGQPLQILSGHNGPVWDTTFNPDGTQIGSAAGDGNVILWDANTGEQLLSIVAHNGAAFHVDFSSDGELFATGGGDNQINIWDAETGDPVGDPLTGHQAGAVCVEFGPDRETIVSSGADSTVRLWDLETRQQTAVLTGHSGLVPLVRMSPDGQMLASGDATGTVILWDISGNPPIGRNMTGHDGPVNDVAIHPVENLMLTAGADSTIRFWDMLQGLQIGEPITHGLRINEPITVLELTSDGGLVSGSRNGTIMTWDPDTGERLAAPMSALVNGVTSLTTSPDGDYILAGGQVGFTSIWDTADGNQIGPFLSGHDGPVTAVAVSSDAQYLATGGQDGSIVVRSVEELQGGQVAGIPTNILAYEWPVPVEISRLWFSNVSEYLFGADSAGNLSAWDFNTQELVDQKMVNDNRYITSLVAFDDGRLVTGDDSGNISLVTFDGSQMEVTQLVQAEDAILNLFVPDDEGEVWAIDGAGKVESLDLDSLEMTSHWQYIDVGNVSSTAVDGQRARLYVGKTDGSIEAYELSNGEVVPVSFNHDSPFLGNVNTVVFSPDGEMFASGAADGTVILWDTETKEPLHEPLIGHTAAPGNIQFSHDGSILASGSCDQFHLSGNCISGEIIIWDVKSFEPLKVLTGTVGFIQALAFSPDDKQIAVTDCSSVEVAGVCLAGVVRLIDWQSGEHTAALEGHNSFIWSADFSPDGRLLATGSADNTIIIWDIQSGERLGQRLANHGGSVRRVAFSPDGTRLASAGLDNTIYLWDVSSGQAIGGPLVTYNNNAMDIAFTSDGKALAAVSLDGTISVLDIDYESWLEKACTRANRNMRMEEWELFFRDLEYKETCDFD